MARKMMLSLVVVFALVAVVSADYMQDFDAFTLGTLQAEENWQANSGINVVETTSDGLYVGGKALNRPSAGDAWPRAIDLDLGLVPNDYDGIEYGFDVRTDNTTLASARMFLRDYPTANYGASFGLDAGTVRIRTNGESPGDDIYGTNLASSAIYGPVGDPDGGYWEKGDWLRFVIRLTGDTFSKATVSISNLSRGGAAIPSGVVEEETGVNYKYHASSWDNVSLRISTGATYVDNTYVENYVIPEPATMTLLGLGMLGAIVRRK